MRREHGALANPARHLSHRLSQRSDQESERHVYRMMGTVIDDCRAIKWRLAETVRGYSENDDPHCDLAGVRSPVDGL
jgi:hypothetical protein